MVLFSETRRAGWWSTKAVVALNETFASAALTFVLSSWIVVVLEHEVLHSVDSSEECFDGLPGLEEFDQRVLVKSCPRAHLCLLLIDLRLRHQ